MSFFGYSVRKPMLIIGLALCAGSLTNCELFQVRLSHPTGPPSTHSGSTRASTSRASASSASTSHRASRGSGRASRGSERYHVASRKNQARTQTPAQAEYQSLIANAVTTRFPEFTQDDAYDLKKVEAAFAKATKDMFVTLSKADYYAHKYRPVTGHKAEYGGFSIAAKKGKPQWKVTWARGVPRIMVIRYPALRKGTVGLIWRSSKYGHAILVTVGGGRYVTSLGKPGALNYKAGLPPVSQWSAALQHVPLVASDLKVLEASGFLTAGRQKKLETARSKGASCNTRVWKRAKGSFRAIERANLTWSTRRNRISHLRGRLKSRARRSCRHHVRRMKKLLGAAIKERTEQRRSLYNKVLQLAAQKLAGSVSPAKSSAP